MSKMENRQQRPRVDAVQLVHGTLLKKKIKHDSGYVHFWGLYVCVAFHLLNA